MREGIKGAHDMPNRPRYTFPRVRCAQCGAIKVARIRPERNFPALAPRCHENANQQPCLGAFEPGEIVKHATVGQLLVITQPPYK